MKKLRWYFTFLFVVIEVSGNVPVISITESYLNNSFPNYCDKSVNDIKCNFTSTNSFVNILEGQSHNLTIIGARRISIREHQCCFKEIYLQDSTDISTQREYLKGSETYKLTIRNSEAVQISNNDISYFKAEKCKITFLYLESLTEFDVNSSTITNFTAKTNSYTPSIIFSVIGSLSLKITNTSKLTIRDTTIGVFEKTVFDTEGTVLIHNVSIAMIKTDGIIIAAGTSVTFSKVNLETLAKASVRVKGRITLSNVYFAKQYPLDWIVIEPEGSLTISKRSEKDNFSRSYTISETNFNFKPFEVIDLKERVWLLITLSVLFGLAVFCHVLYLIWFFMFSKTKLREKIATCKNRLSNLPFNELENKPGTAKASNVYTIEEAQQDKPASTMDPVTTDLETKMQSATKQEENFFLSGDHRLNEQSKPANQLHNNLDSNNLEDYTNPDHDELEDYTEPDANAAGSASKLDQNFKSNPPNYTLPTYPVVPPKIPPTHKSAITIKPKPTIPKRECTPAEPGSKQPNISFLGKLNCNFPLSSAPPPPAVAVSFRNLNSTPKKMPPPPPVRKTSHENETIYDSQEEYDNYEEGDD